MNAPKILLLAGDGISSRIVHHALAEKFGPLYVAVETPASRSRLIRRRFKTLGVRTVIGQILFLALIRPLLSRQGRARVKQICSGYHLQDQPFPSDALRVSSVNSLKVQDFIAQIAPEIVVVNGTRILTEDTLSVIRCPIINTHAGITPLYRGSHGGYWALCEQRPDLAGTTVHLVDKGIDTGSVVAQATFSVTGEDSFVTYPFLHLAAGVPLLLDAVERGLNGSLEAAATQPDLPSRLRSHPTAWGYLWRRLRIGVR